ncbi:hypothetical protein CCACVL1_08386, partial [Corchorus capsularis]
TVMSSEIDYQSPIGTQPPSTQSNPTKGQGLGWGPLQFLPWSLHFLHPGLPHAH